MYYIGIGLSWMRIIYNMYIHIIPAVYIFAMELGSGYNILLLLFECIMYIKVYTSTRANCPMQSSFNEVV